MLQPSWVIALRPPGVDYFQRSMYTLVVWKIFFRTICSHQWKAPAFIIYGVMANLMKQQIGPQKKKKVYIYISVNIQSNDALISMSMGENPIWVGLFSARKKNNWASEKKGKGNFNIFNNKQWGTCQFSLSFQGEQSSITVILCHIVTYPFIQANIKRFRFCTFFSQAKHDFQHRKRERHACTNRTRKTKAE